MTITEPAPTTPNASALAGRTVVVIGGSSGIGRETARQAGAAGAHLIITGRDPERLARAAQELAATGRALDLEDPEEPARFFADLGGPIDHVLVTGGGPVYSPLATMDFDAARRVLDEHLLGALRIGRACATALTPSGSLTLMTGSDARRPGIGSSIAAITAAAVPAIVANLALELAPVRVNAVAAGFVNTPLSARILGDALEERRAELRATLPIRRTVEPSDIAAAVLHLMSNTAVTGATLDVDGGQWVASA